MSVEEALNEIRDQLAGRLITSEEREGLVKLGSNMEKLAWLFDRMMKYPLTRTIFRLDEDDDLSGLGVDLEWMSPADIIEESFKYIPGTAAYPLGYVPVGSCLIGSGDPYFINSNVPDNPPLVRIPHDSLDEQDQLITERIELVSETLASFLYTSKKE